MRELPTTERDAARVLIVDGGGRILLQRYEAPDGSIVFWGTPGGGLSAGETHEEAARRELDEELGIVDAAFGPCIWLREQLFVWEGRGYFQRERIFVWFVDGLALRAVDAARPIDGVITAQRWWAVDELHAAASTTTFAPRRLPMLVEELLRDGPPPAPLDVGV